MCYQDLTGVLIGSLCVFSTFWASLFMGLWVFVVVLLQGFAGVALFLLESPIPFPCVPKEYSVTQFRLLARFNS